MPRVNRQLIHHPGVMPKRSWIPFNGQNKADRRQYRTDLTAWEQAIAHNEMVTRRDNMLDASPQWVQNIPNAEVVADRVVDLQDSGIARGAAGLGRGVAGVMGGVGGTLGAVGGALGNPWSRGALAVGAGSAVTAGALLAGANDLESDGYYNPGLAASAGRAASNIGGAIGSYMADPLARARNNIQESGELLGSPAVLEAMANDQVEVMEQPDPNQPFDYEVMALIDARAKQLQGTPIPSADGPKPMPWDTAQNRATEQVIAELRANGVL